METTTISLGMQLKLCHPILGSDLHQPRMLHPGLLSLPCWTRASCLPWQRTVILEYKMMLFRR